MKGGGLPYSGIQTPGSRQTDSVGRNLKKSATKENVMNVSVTLCCHINFISINVNSIFSKMSYFQSISKTSIITVDYHFVILMDTFCSFELRKST